MKPSRWYPRALQDADEAAQWFAGAGGTALELAFIDALQAAVELLERHPEAGSTRHVGVLDFPEGSLRFLPIRRFDDYLIYYIALADHIRVVRIWNARRGLDALLDTQ